MTVEQRDKYAYELMVKNNPEEAVKQLLLKDKIIEKTQQDYDKEHYSSHKLGLELSLEKDKVLELSNNLTLYSSEETMLKQINNLKARIDKAIKFLEDHSLCWNDESEQDLYIEEVKDLYKLLKGE